MVKVAAPVTLSAVELAVIELPAPATLPVLELAVVELAAPATLPAAELAAPPAGVAPGEALPSPVRFALLACGSAGGQDGSVASLVGGLGASRFSSRTRAHSCQENKCELGKREVCVKCEEWQGRG